MTESERSPLPWETKAALVVLGLFWLQWLHEAWLLCAGGPGFPHSDEETASVGFLVTFAAVGIGLVNRSRTAWWFAVFLSAGLGLAYLGRYWERIGELLPFVGGTPKGYSVELPRERSALLLFWWISRIVLPLSAALLLSLGRVRKKLQAT